MPTYCYKNEQGGAYDVTMSMAEKESLEIDGKGTIIKDGQILYRDLIREHEAFKHTYGATYPMESDAAGVHPDQIPEAKKADAEAGVRGTEYTAAGNPIFTSARHRKEYCEAHGLHDRNAGYSDPQKGY